MTGPQRDTAAVPDRRPGPPLDALAGPDGTQDPPPPPPFPDALSGLLTGDLVPRQRRIPTPPPPAAPAVDHDAVARTARQLATAPVRRRSNQPQRAQSTRPPVVPPRQPRAIAPAGSAPGQRRPGQRRMGAGSWLILLIVLAILAWNLLRSVLGNLPVITH